MKKDDYGLSVIQNRTARLIYFFAVFGSVLLFVFRHDVLPPDVAAICIAAPFVGFFPSFSKRSNKTIHGIVFTCCSMWNVYRMAFVMDYADHLDYYMLVCLCVSTFYLEELVLVSCAGFYVALFFGTVIYNVNYNPQLISAGCIEITVSFLMVLATSFILLLTIRRSRLKLNYIQRRNQNFSQMAKLLQIKKDESEAVSKSKIDFLANTSHEIRTPMNAIIGMSELALREDVSPDVRQYLNSILGASKNLLAIINDVLDFSKIESQKIELYDSNYSITNILDDVCNIVSPRIDVSAVQLMTDINPSIPGILYGDELRIKQVLLNLVTNAVKFTPRGSITIKVDFRNINEDRIVLCVSVRDTGIGIRQKDLDALFRAFEQVRSNGANNTEGTGLGLVISKSLVELMDGKISVNSVFGTGSEFFFEVPQRVIDRKCCISVRGAWRFNTAVLVSNMTLSGLIDRVMSQLELKSTVYRSFDEWYYESGGYTHSIISYDFYEANTEQINRLAGKMSISVVSEYDLHIPLSRGIQRLANPITVMSVMKLYESGDKEKSGRFTAPDAKILIVDDNKTNILVASSLMKPYNMSITTTDRGAKAVELIRKNSYDIVFMDHMMPEMDGVEATRLIRTDGERNCGVVIVVLTANAVSGTSNYFFEAGMNDFLAKPIKPVELNSILEKWIPDSKRIYGDTRAESRETSEKESLMAGAIEGLREIPSLNVDFGLSQCLRDIDLYVEILDTAIHSATFNELLEAYERDDIVNYTIFIHGLKGSARNIGMGIIGDLAFELELAGKRGDVEFIHANHRSFVEEYTALSKRIEEVMAPFVMTEKKESADISEHIPLLEDIKSACADFDYSWATNILEAIAGKTFGREADLQLERISADIDAFEFDAAAEKTDGLMKWSEANGK